MHKIFVNMNRPVHRANRGRFVAVLFAICAGLLWSAACGNENQDGPPELSGTPPLEDGGGTGDACAHPNTGCPCTDVGATADCGSVDLKIGDYVSCSMGKTTSDGSKWGLCVGDTVIAQTFHGGGVRVQSLGVSASCSSPDAAFYNPCDPYCNAFVDSPGNLDAAGLSSTDGGLYIPGTSPNACTCNEPTTPASLYSNIVSANKGNPASCAGNDAGTATDNCNHDYHCIGGSCKPYSVAGVNPACTTSTDYTLGLGCYDGASWELQVCNRGYIPTPGVGHLIVAIGSGSPSTAPGACTTGTSGASWPTGPAITSGGPDQGTCNIDLSTVAIGPGQCINVSLATQCTQLDGKTPLAFSSTVSEHWAVVNPSTAIAPGTTTLPECDTCNDYTSLEQSAVPPALSSAASCLSTTCGTVCGGGTSAGVDGGMGCHTYVSGTVYDPGGNLPLPGVAVYEPSTALPAFSAGVSCDTCQSVLPPAASIVTSTFSDLTGTFNLEVDALSGVPVVFQSGRWRREITIGVDTPVLTACAVNNITVANDCYAPGTATQPNNWPATNCKTRLPQTQAEGNIPFTAVVTGAREPFECSIAKFMGGTTEMNTGTGRIQMYQDTGSGNVVVPAKTGTKAIVGTPPATASGTGWILKAGGVVANLSNSTDTTSGTKQTISKTPPVTVTKLAALTSSYVSGTLTMWGGAAGNNGSFPILTVPGATSATITDAAAANATTTGSWAASGVLGNLTAAYVGGTLKLTGGGTAANNATFAITAVPSSTSATVSGIGTTDTKNGQSSLTWLATAPGVLTISGLSGMLGQRRRKEHHLLGSRQQREQRNVSRSRRSPARRRSRSRTPTPWGATRRTAASRGASPRRPA